MGIIATKEHAFFFHLQDIRAWLGNWLLIQGDPGGKFNILGRDDMGYCEKKNYMNVCLILNGYRGRAVSVFKYKSIL